MYFLPECATFCVAVHNGQWCMFAFNDSAEIASTKEQIEAVKSWGRANLIKFYSSAD